MLFAAWRMHPTNLWVSKLSLHPPHCTTNVVPRPRENIRQPSVLAVVHLDFCPRFLRNACGLDEFHRPIHLDSEETQNTLKGDIYAVVDYPFATVNSAFNDPQQGPANWCEVLILHLNTQYCHATSGANGAIISMNVGKKTEQELGDTFRVQFNYRSVATSPDYFQVDLSAAEGPLSTKDYRIVLEAVDIGKGHTFLHLTYSYGFGMAGRLAMKTYLATIGSAKVGFTQTSSGDYIGGVRGLVERNTMRYYLAIDAYLGSLAIPADKRVDQRFAAWFDATEQYPRQLHELDRQAYLQMKKNEYQRQQTAQ